MTQLTTPTDHMLKASIEKELQWYPEITSDHIGVAVMDGIATLSGQVATYPEKLAAVKAALRVRGVTGIADELVVRHAFGHLSDADIARDAATALRASVVVPRDSVKATVHEHFVRLTGTVQWNFQRETAARIVGQLPGVAGLLDEIVLAPCTALSEAQAEERIRSALARNAAVDGRTIRVHAAGSTVELTGTVQSWAEFRQASTAAWATPGVKAVQNHIRVVS